MRALNSKFQKYTTFLALPHCKQFESEQQNLLSMQNDPRAGADLHQIKVSNVDRINDSESMTIAVAHGVFL